MKCLVPVLNTPAAAETSPSADMRGGPRERVLRGRARTRSGSGSIRVVETWKELNASGEAWSIDGAGTAMLLLLSHLCHRKNLKDPAAAAALVDAAVHRLWTHGAMVEATALALCGIARHVGNAAAHGALYGYLTAQLKEAALSAPFALAVKAATAQAQHALVQWTSQLSRPTPPLPAPAPAFTAAAFPGTAAVYQQAHAELLVRTDYSSLLACTAQGLKASRHHGTAPLQVVCTYSMRRER